MGKRLFLRQVGAHPCSKEQGVPECRGEISTEQQPVVATSPCNPLLRNTNYSLQTPDLMNKTQTWKPCFGPTQPQLFHGFVDALFL